MPTTPHPLVLQLRFSRSEFLRGVKGVSDQDGAVRLGPMNCLAWNVGHLAWQEQRNFLTRAQGLEPGGVPVQVVGAEELPVTMPSINDVLAAASDLRRGAAYTQRRWTAFCSSTATA